MSIPSAQGEGPQPGQCFTIETERGCASHSSTDQLGGDLAVSRSMGWGRAPTALPEGSTGVLEEAVRMQPIKKQVSPAQPLPLSAAQGEALLPAGIMNKLLDHSTSP